jgi:uncharacterized protein (DUF433 family)
MAGPVDIGTLIDEDPGIRGGRPKIAGAGVTVMRLAGWHNQGWIPEEIAANYQHISLAQVFARRWRIITRIRKKSTRI